MTVSKKFFLLICLLLFHSLISFAKTDSHLAFEAYILNLLEKRVLGDEELLKFAEKLDAGELSNPLCNGARCSTVHRIHVTALQEFLDEDIDITGLRDWVHGLLEKRGHDQCKREETQEKTKNLFPPISSRVAVANNHACVINTQGKLECWGKNTFGQGDVPSSTQDVLAVATDYASTCIIEAGGTVRCWGRNNLGQCDVPEDLEEVVQIGMYDGRVCALQKSGQIRRWGFELWVPETVDGLDRPVQISVGGQLCVLDASGTVQCWGWIISDPAPSDLGFVLQVSAGFRHNCVLLENQKIECWGDNRAEPNTVPDIDGFVQVATGTFHSCGLLASGQVRCWGNNDIGQLGIPKDLPRVVQIYAGGHSTCALLEDGSLRCWGDIESPPSSLRVSTDGLKFK